MKLPAYEMARLRKIEEWALKERATHVRYRWLGQKITTVVNLMLGTSADVDDTLIPVSNVEWLLNVIKRELEQK